MDLKLWHEVNTPKLEYSFVDKKQELWYDYEPSEDGRKRFEFEYLK